MSQPRNHMQFDESIHSKHIARRTEMAGDHWDLTKAKHRALEENIILSAGHWSVITYLRKHYLNQGLPKNARILANDLERHFIFHGGNKYLRQLFPQGPVTQGCRIANLPVPANNIDLSFGISY